MRLYRVWNLSEHGPATPLHFLERQGADRFVTIFRWPHEPSGFYLRQDGGELPLAELQLRVESVDMPVLVDEGLESVFSFNNGELGRCYLLPGRCFDPDDWKPVSEVEWGTPGINEKLEEAGKKLVETLRRKK